MADPGLDGVGEEGSLVLEQRFAIVPEWVIDADISDCAYRLYSVLLRYGQTSGCRMPGRATLADRLHKTSKDTVDRALKELVAVGAVVVEHRHRDGRHLTNRYHLMSTPPAARRIDPAPGGRKFAATPGRMDAATLAANLRPNPEFFTEEPPPPPPPPHSRRHDGGGGTQPSDPELLRACAIDDLQELAQECQRLRRSLGRPTARWSAPRLLEVLRQAVAVRGWPATLAAAALRTLAADPATLSPMRLPCPGPWWDAAECRQQPDQATVLAVEREALETRLGDAGGSRVWAQQQARAELAERGEPITRLTVARRACELLDDAETTAC